MKKCYLVMLVLSFAFLSFVQINVYADDATYKDAIQHLKNGNEEFAFAKFSHIVKWNKESKYRDEALFRIAEYHFNSNGFTDAERALDEHLATYVNSSFKGEVTDYLYKIKSMQGDCRESLKGYQS